MLEKIKNKLAASRDGVYLLSSRKEEELREDIQYLINEVERLAYIKKSAKEKPLCRVMIPQVGGEYRRCKRTAELHKPFCFSHQHWKMEGAAEAEAKLPASYMKRQQLTNQENNNE